MNSKERVLTALRHERPDRIPINFRAVDVIIDRLKRHYGVEYEALLDHLWVDFRELEVPYSGPELGRTGDDCALDIWGVGRREVITEKSRDVFVRYMPLEKAEDVEEVRAHKWPKAEWFDFSTIAEQCGRYREYAVCTPGIHAEGYHGVFHQLTYLFGMEQALVNLIVAPELVEEAIGHIMEFMLDYYERLFQAGGGDISLMFYKDDYGTQQSLMIRGEQFERFFKPCIRRLADLAHRYNVKFIMHSCGSVQPLIPGFIDAGVDVLDPIQTSAKNMEIEVLKERFGDQLVFHGAIDTQKFLPNATPGEVEELVKKTIRVLGGDGGYLFSSSHRIQQDTPLENIIAMYDTAKSFTEY